MSGMDGTVVTAQKNPMKNKATDRRPTLLERKGTEVHEGICVNTTFILASSQRAKAFML